jgi:hypothetical protein
VEHPEKRRDAILKRGVKRPIAWVVLPSGCHECTSHCRTSSGYPHIRRQEKNVTIARWLWLQRFGPIPEGLVLRHSCDNKGCINLDHLSLGTQKQNVHDTLSRGNFNQHAKTQARANGRWVKAPPKSV